MFAINLIKTVVLVYDTITLPLYYIIQKPWKRKNDKLKANWVKDGDIEYLVRAGQPPKSHLDNYLTVAEATADVCARFPGKKCMGVRECISEEEITTEDKRVLKKKVLAPAYKWYTFAQIDKLIDDFMKGLQSTGLKSGTRVVLFSETRMEWMVSFQSCARMGCPVATLYANLGKDGIIHVLNETEAEYVILSHEVLPKLRPIASDLRFLRKIIVLPSGNGSYDSKGLEKFSIFSFSDLVSKGAQIRPNTYPIVPPKPQDVAMIMYTSGSTGVPKGVLISNSNFVHSARCMLTIVLEYENLKNGHYIAYLPLAHSFECFVESSVLWSGYSVGYSNPLTLTNASPALKAGVPGDLSVLQPHLFCGVPLVLDRIRKEVTKQVESKGGLVEQLFKFGIEYKNYWISKGYKTPLLDKIVFKKTIAALGGKVEIVISGGAPLSVDTQLFTRASMGVNIIVGYSATESCASGTCMHIDDLSIGNVGAPLHGCKMRLVPWEEGGYYPTDKPNPRGEILIGGPHVSLGYFKNPVETVKAFKDEHGDRWFYTGDIGEFLPTGGIKIIDRRKDLVKLQFGEYISLGKVESALLAHPFIEQICVYGDPLHNYTIALIVPIRQAVMNIARSFGLENSSFDEICDNIKVNEATIKSLSEFGTKMGLNKYEIPRRIRLCKEEWTPDSGLVTAALKIRRNEIKKFYIEDIKRMYSDEAFDQNQNMRKV